MTQEQEFLEHLNQKDHTRNIAVVIHFHRLRC